MIGSTVTSDDGRRATEIDREPPGPGSPFFLQRASEATATPEQTAIRTDHQTYGLDSVELRK